MKTYTSKPIRLAIVPIALLLAGATSGCFYEEKAPPQIHLAGVHHRWDPDGTVTITAHVVNVGQTIFPKDGGIETISGKIHLFPVSDGPVEISSFTFEDEWRPGRHEEISLVAQGNETLTYYARIDALADTGPRLDDLLYTSPCFSKQGYVRNGEGNACFPTYGGNGGGLSANETAWRERLIACCNWLPPSFDVVSFACQAEVGGTRCELTIYNWRAESREPRAHYKVVQSDPTGGRTVIGEGNVTPSGAVDGGERTTLSFLLDIQQGLPTTPGVAREVEVVVGSTEEYEGQSGSTTPVTLSPGSAAHATVQDAFLMAFEA